MVAIRTAYRHCPPPEPCTAPNLRVVPKNVPEHAGAALLAEIEAFIRRNPHFTQTRLGREAVRNSELVNRLHYGLNPQPVTINKVRNFIRQHDGKARR